MPGLGFLVILKKAISWDPKLGEASWELTQDKASWFLSLGEAGPVVDYGMRARFLGLMEQSA